MASPSRDTLISSSIGKMFPGKLHQLLDDVNKDGNDDAISWMPDGKSFKVHNKKKFETEIMPKYFGSSKFRSFQKNLNLWEFKCDALPSSPQRGECSHPLFVRGCPEICEGMKRVVKNKLIKKAKEPCDEFSLRKRSLNPAVVSPSPAPSLLESSAVSAEHSQVLRLIHDAMSAQSTSQDTSRSCSDKFRVGSCDTVSRVAQGATSVSEGAAGLLPRTIAALCAGLGRRSLVPPLPGAEGSCAPSATIAFLQEERNRKVAAGDKSEHFRKNDTASPGQLSLGVALSSKPLTSSFPSRSGGARLATPSSSRQDLLAAELLLRAQICREELTRTLELLDQLRG